MFMVLAVFVLKSSSAKRQNINIVSLFLVVLAPDDVPAEARLTLLRGSFFALGFGLSQVSDAGETNAPALPPSGMSLFFLFFFQSVMSPTFSLALTHSPSFSIVRHGSDSSSVPLFNDAAAAHPPRPIHHPVLPFSLRLTQSRSKAPWDASNTAVIFQYPQRIQNSLSTVPSSLRPLPLISSLCLASLLRI